MQKKKQRTHLTPDEVQEFINLGVDFGETTLVYELRLVDKVEQDYSWHLRVRTNTLPKKGKILPAPNLQEVFDVLPKYLQRKHSDDTEKYYLSLWRDSDDEWTLAYYIPYMGVMTSHIDDNLLECAIRLLRWVCKNHPQTLIKTE